MVKVFFQFLIFLAQSRDLLLQLTLRDFKTRYLGSFLGLLWALIQPVCTILIFWFVFQVGFKATPVKNFPFILWLLCGIVPWFYIAEAIGNGTNCIVENSYLVKKVVFRVSVLPVVKLISALIIHLFFVLVIFLLFFFYGYNVSLYNLQLFYYIPALSLLLLGIIFLTSSLTVFLKDTSHFISMILQFGFWLTPIFWSIETVPQQYQFILKMNPFFYIIQGFRDSFINQVWFWQHPVLSGWFWLVSCITFVGGALVFARLRPHFADVM